MSKAKTAVKHMLTEGDNETVDLFRVTFALAMVIFFIAFGYLMYHGKTGLAEFANSFLQLFGGGAAGTGVKSKLEGLAIPRAPVMPETPQQPPQIPVMPPRMPGQMPPRG